MATPQPANNARVTVASLLSPPETKRLDSFSSPAQASMSRTPSSSFSSDKQPLAHAFESLPSGRAYASPPISPLTKEAPRHSQEIDNRDPPLFGSQENGPAPEVPLFPPEETSEERPNAMDVDTESTIDQHMSSNDNLFPEGVAKPLRDQYELISKVYFKSTVNTQFAKNPRGWIHRERQIIAKYPAAGQHRRSQKPVYQKIAPAPQSSQPRRQKIATSVSRPNRVSKPTPRAARRTPQPRGSPAANGSPVAPKTPKQPRVDDCKFEEVEDYCPRLDTLPKGKSIKVEWKGQPLDLSKDPNKHLLLETEVVAASILRLSCAGYLTTKRRIFKQLLEDMQRGKTFRKTDAQQATNIDVNKASRLWAAYEKVGWFKREHFEQWLR